VKFTIQPAEVTSYTDYVRHVKNSWKTELDEVNEANDEASDDLEFDDDSEVDDIRIRHFRARLLKLLKSSKAPNVPRQSC